MALLGRMLLFLFIGGGIISILISKWVNAVNKRTIPRDIEEPDVVRWLDEYGRLADSTSSLIEKIGIDVASPSIKMVVDRLFSIVLQGLWPKGNENVTISRTEMSGVPVVIFYPGPPTKRSQPAMLYFHGGGWTWFSVDSYSGYLQHLSWKTGLTIYAPEFRQAPTHPFPAPYQDCSAVAKHLVKNAVSLHINLKLLMIGGDGSGGNLAAAVAMVMKARFHLQWLINPVLQNLDFKSPSYQDHVDTLPGLTSPTRSVINWMSYLNISSKFQEQFLTNQHVSIDMKLSNMASYVDSKKHIPDYLNVTMKKSGFNPGSHQELWRTVDKLVREPRLSPSLAENLKGVPNAYIVASQYDVYRDDGIMYAHRLKEAGVRIKLDYQEHGFHGFYLFCGKSPYKLAIADKVLDSFVAFLETAIFKNK